MRTRDNYDHLIALIEQEAQAAFPKKAKDILARVEAESGYSSRDISTVFQYMTGQTLQQYITYRKMSAAFDLLRQGGEMTDAVDISGLGEQSNFIRKFKGYCGIPPIQALKDENSDLFQPAQTWEILSMPENERPKKKEYEEAVSQMKKFGIDLAVYNKVSEATDLQVTYGFNDIQANAAFMMAEKLNLPMPDAFAFIDEFSLQFASDDSGRFNGTESQFSNIIDDWYELIYVCFNLDLSVWQAMDLINELHRFGADAAKMDYRALLAYQNTEFSISEINQLLRFFDEQSPEGSQQASWDEFLEYVHSGYTPEDAYAIVTDDPYPTASDVENAFHPSSNDEEPAWIADETDFYDPGYRHEEFDVDNFGYDDTEE